MVENNLLDALAKVMHLSCLSDLRDMPKYRLYSVVQTIDKNHYSLAQWNYFLSYVFTENIAIKNLDEVEAFFNNNN